MVKLFWRRQKHSFADLKIREKKLLFFWRLHFLLDFGVLSVRILEAYFQSWNAASEDVSSSSSSSSTTWTFDFQIEIGYRQRRAHTSAQCRNKYAASWSDILQKIFGEILAKLEQYFSSLGNIFSKKIGQYFPVWPIFFNLADIFLNLAQYFSSLGNIFKNSSLFFQFGHYLSNSANFCQIWLIFFQFGFLQIWSHCR